MKQTNKNYKYKTIREDVQKKEKNSKHYLVQL